MWYWSQEKQIDQWNKIENPETDPCVYGFLIYGRDITNHLSEGKDDFFNK